MSGSSQVHEDARFVQVARFQQGWKARSAINPPKFAANGGNGALFYLIKTSRNHISRCWSKARGVRNFKNCTGSVTNFKAMHGLGLTSCYICLYSLGKQRTIKTVFLFALSTKGLVQMPFKCIQCFFFGGKAMYWVVKDSN